MPKRRFGRVRKLPSGRYQARYRGPDGIDRPAPRTFASKTDAERWLIRVEAEIIRDSWRNPNLGRVRLADYLNEWICQRPGLRPRTVDLYGWLSRRYLVPALGDRMLCDLTPGIIRAWHAELVAGGVGRTMVAKAYRLLRAVLNTAVDDELIARNPCRIKGAGAEHAPERPTATVAQVLRLADNVPARFRALVLLAAFTSLRYGELAALRRRDIDSDCTTVTVRASLVERPGGVLVLGPPKTAAGRRTVTVPAAMRADIRDHLDAYAAEDDPQALVFTGAKGAALRRGNFHRAVRWSEVTARVGLHGFHFHDLRHTGNTLASQSGASLADLMARMGHSSTRPPESTHTRLNSVISPSRMRLATRSPRNGSGARSGHSEA